MVDRITEFYNGDVSLDALLAGADIASTSATQTAVVRDVFVSIASDVGFTLSTGGTSVAKFEGSATLSGSEIVPPSGALKIEAAVSWLLNGVITVSSNFQEFTTTTLFQPLPSAFKVAPKAAPVSIVAPSATPDFACFDANGNYYYSSPGQQTIYKRAGGINGTQTTFVLGYTPVYDGSYYIYAVNSSSQVRRYHTQTGVIDGSGLVSGYANATAMAATIDGYVVVRSASSDANNYIVNPATGTVLPIAGYSSPSAQKYLFQIGKRSNGDYVVVQTNYTTPNITWKNVGPDLSAPLVKDAGTINTAPIESADQSNRLFRSETDPSSLFFLNNTGLQMLDLETMQLGSVISITGLAAADSFIPVFDEAAAVNDFGQVRVRATGILIEEA